LEAELRKNFQNIDIRLISSGGGVFEVQLDKQLIFSKKSLGRFPKQSEIVDIIIKKTS
jgi:selT/selW/selH-like putative selenoprotein